MQEEPSRVGPISPLEVTAASGAPEAAGSHAGAPDICKGASSRVQSHQRDAGQRASSVCPCCRHPDHMGSDPEIIGGPTPIEVPRDGDFYRWKVQYGHAEQHVYVQIARSLKAEAFEEPLRSGIESKGETVLLKLLERGNVPTRIKITSAGITEVGTDRRSRPCSV
jgi:hypothetical protein